MEFNPEVFDTLTLGKSKAVLFDMLVEATQVFETDAEINGGDFVAWFADFRVFSLNILDKAESTEH